MCWLFSLYRWKQLNYKLRSKFSVRGFIGTAASLFLYLLSTTSQEESTEGAFPNLLSSWCTSTVLFYHRGFHCSSTCSMLGAFLQCLSRMAQQVATIVYNATRFATPSLNHHSEGTRSIYLELQFWQLSFCLRCQGLSFQVWSFTIYIVNNITKRSKETLWIQ